MGHRADHNTAWHLPSDTHSQIPLVKGVVVTAPSTISCFWQSPFVKSLIVKGKL